jgi:TPR repeat protein
MSHIDVDLCPKQLTSLCLLDLLCRPLGLTSNVGLLKLIGRCPGPKEWAGFVGLLRLSEENVKKRIQQCALAFIFCTGFHSHAQTAFEEIKYPPGTLIWKPDRLGCGSLYLNGDDDVWMSTDQAFIMVNLEQKNLGKLSAWVVVKNPKEGKGRIEVLPENVHLFKVFDKGLVEINRIEAVKLAKSMERRERIGQAIAAGLSAAGSQTTATGTATYSDGSTATYSVNMPNPQAQTDAINRARENIGMTQAIGAGAVASELTRNTLYPGQGTIGQVFFPKQKNGENMLVEIDIGEVRYKFPLQLSKKNGVAVARDVSQEEDSQPPKRAVQAAVDTAQQTMPTDPVQKAAWYRKAADQGDAKAQFIVGTLYFTGQGVPQDYVQSAAWLRKSAEQGDADAQNGLGLLYDLGQGVPQDYSQAVEWYRKAADQGLPAAQFSLGFRYAHGHGVTQDYAQAATWYRRAADQGNAKAQNNLGDLYEHGQGVPQDYALAVVWYRKAADQGNTVAQFGLGSLYFAGRGVSQDNTEAYFWFNVAAARAKGKDLERDTMARDEAAAKLTPGDLSDAQRRAADWFVAHPPQP